VSEISKILAASLKDSLLQYNEAPYRLYVQDSNDSKISVVFLDKHKKDNPGYEQFIGVVIADGIILYSRTHEQAQFAIEDPSSIDRLLLDIKKLMEDDQP